MTFLKLFLPNLFASSDMESLGRLDYCMLSQQALMELLVEKVPYRFVKGENFKDITNWYGVKLNESEEVIEIRWNISLCSSTGQSIDMKWTPPTVQVIFFNSNKVINFDANHIPVSARQVQLIRCGLSGSFSSENLPRNIEDLRLSINSLTGTIDIQNLPRKIRCFHVAENNFHGTIKWKSLPEPLASFNASKNNLTGTIDLPSLPAKIEELSLSENKFHGSIEASCLPLNMRSLSLHTNLLSGKVDIVMYCSVGRTATKVTMNIHHNEFSGTLIYLGGAPLERHAADSPVLKQLYCVSNRFTCIDWKSMNSIYFLDASENIITGSLDISEIPESIKNLYLCRNEIFGSLDLASLHSTMVYLRLSKNKFSGSVDLAHLPQAMKGIDLSENNLAGSIFIGDYIPPNIYLNDNQFTSLNINHKKSWESVRKFSIANNKIEQNEVKFGKLGKHFYRFDLRGNSIKCLKNANGHAVKSKNICYDNAAYKQAEPDRYLTKSDWPKCH